MDANRFRTCPPTIKLAEIARASKISEKAKDFHLQNLYTKYYGDHPELFLYSDIAPELIDYADKDHRNNRYAFITINTDPSKLVDPRPLLPMLQRLSTYTWIRRWAAAIEFYTETSSHIHIHIAIEKQPDKIAVYNKSKLISRFYDIYKQYLSDESKVDVRSPKKIENKISYIKGIKSDPVKKLNVIRDKEWRISQSIQDYYGNWEQVGNVGLVTNPIPSIQVVSAFEPPALPGYDKLRN